MNRKIDDQKEREILQSISESYRYKIIYMYIYNIIIYFILRSRFIIVIIVNYCYNYGLK